MHSTSISSISISILILINYLRKIDAKIRISVKLKTFFLNTLDCLLIKCCLDFRPKNSTNSGWDFCTTFGPFCNVFFCFHFFVIWFLFTVFGFGFEFELFLKKTFERTLKYFPAKSCTPIMAKISQNIRHTNSTLKMDGIACTSALTTTWLYDNFGFDIIFIFWYTNFTFGGSSLTMFDAGNFSRFFFSGWCGSCGLQEQLLVVNDGGCLLFFFIIIFFGGEVYRI